jgi:hypothetical protein
MGMQRAASGCGKITGFSDTEEGPKALKQQAWKKDDAASGSCCSSPSSFSHLKDRAAGVGYV